MDVRLELLERPASDRFSGLLAIPNRRAKRQDRDRA
jgi:hypothetical protein